MPRLFLIGNGYDINRRGDTSYFHFKNWLVKEYFEKDYKNILKDGDIDYSLLFDRNYAPPCILKNLEVKNEQEQKKLNDSINKAEKHDISKTLALLFKSMEYLYDVDWNKFEDNLSLLPLKRFVEEYKKYNEEHGIKLDSSFGSPVDREVDEICFNNKISFLFTEWIANLKELNIDKKPFENQIIKSINEDDTFIIFNYTDTIEKLFNNYDKNIFYHIHGVQTNKDSIIVGHNCKEKSASINLDNEEQYIQDIYSSLYKKPEKVIENNQYLWDRISKCKELNIYEFGWSCSNVDSDYIEKIVSIINENNIKLRVHFNDFNNEGINKINMWKKCGLNQNCIYYLYEETDCISERIYEEL